jgi:hypothetical protein
VDEAGNIYTTDVRVRPPAAADLLTGRQFLHMFAEKGTLPGMILRGHGLWFDSKGRLYATDVDNMRVNVYEHGGKFLFSHSARTAQTQMNSTRRTACTWIPTTTCS